mgnify:FL=1|jgi:hypothetical protein
MGEIADLTINGFFDEQTGEVIDGRVPGYPRTLESGHRQHIGGVLKYLKNKGFDKKESSLIMKKFLQVENDTKDEMCLKISANFGSFVKFINKNKKNDNNTKSS